MPAASGHLPPAWGQRNPPVATAPESTYHYLHAAGGLNKDVLSGPPGLTPEVHKFRRSVALVTCLEEHTLLSLPCQFRGRGAPALPILCRQEVKGHLTVNWKWQVPIASTPQACSKTLAPPLPATRKVCTALICRKSSRQDLTLQLHIRQQRQPKSSHPAGDREGARGRHPGGGQQWGPRDGGCGVGGGNGALGRHHVRPAQRTCQPRLIPR